MITAADASTPAAASAVVRARVALWRLARGTAVSAFRYRVTGLAAEAAFFTLLSLPPLVLGMIGTLGHFRSVLGARTVAEIRDWAIARAQVVLTEQTVRSVVRPLIEEVLRGGQVGIVSLSFLISLWAGSRALNVYVDTITIAHGLSGMRGVVRTRLRAFVLYLGGLGVGLIVIPLLVAGPALVLHWLPAGAVVLRVLYWPILIVVAIVFLALLYHLSVPLRTSWWREVPGGVLALAIWGLGSLVLRWYLDGSASGVSVYGSLGAAIAVLAWLYVTALAVLIGAALNAEIDTLWPGDGRTDVQTGAQSDVQTGVRTGVPAGGQAQVPAGGQADAQAKGQIDDQAGGSAEAHAGPAEAPASR